MVTSKVKQAKHEEKELEIPEEERSRLKNKNGGVGRCGGLKRNNEEEEEKRR